MPKLDADFDRLAQSQLGLLTHEQLLALRWTQTMIEHAVAVGRLSVVHGGVYRLVGVPVTYQTKLQAACLAAGPSSVVSHRAASFVWGLSQREGPVEITVPLAQCPTSRGVLQHRSTDLIPSHVMRRDGLRVTSPTRLLVDLGAVAPYVELRTVADAAVLKGLTTWPKVYAMVAAVGRRGRRGIGPLRRVLDDRPFGGRPIESVLEPVMGRIIRDHGIERVFYQYEVEVAGKVYRIDFGVPHVRVGLEIDGIEWHGTREAAKNDRVRRRALKTAGWELLEYTVSELRRRPAGVAREVSAYIGEREQLFAALGISA